MSWVWLGKGLISRMLVGGFAVPVLAGLGLICARCVAGLVAALGLL